MPKKILVVDDDPDILTLLGYNLEKEGFRVSLCETGDEALKRVQTEKPDLLVLDIMLPGTDGREICRILKGNPESRHLPVLMLTAKGEETDIVVGLELGADDYLTKPFSPKVLVAHVKALLRRAEAGAPPAGGIRLGPFSIDAEKREVLVGAQPLALTATEFNLLQCMARRAGRVFSRDELLNQAWSGDTVVVDRTVDVHIVSLRKKLGKYAGAIETVRGIGYRFRGTGSPKDRFKGDGS